MTINDEDIRKISIALESSRAFLCTLATGDGFDVEAYETFINKMKLCRESIASLPQEIRDICISMVEIPLLMQNSLPIVDKAVRQKYENSILEVCELFCNLFGLRQND